jgi:CheB methylesterase
MEPRFPSPPEGGLWVVGLVASTGGLAALGQVLAPLPAGFPAAVVALQHVRPEHDPHRVLLAPGTPLAQHAPEGRAVVGLNGPLLPCRCPGGTQATWLVAAAHAVPPEPGDFGILAHSGYAPAARWRWRRCSRLRPATSSTSPGRPVVHESETRELTRSCFRTLMRPGRAWG